MLFDKKKALNQVLGMPPGGEDAKLGKMSDGGEVHPHLLASAQEAIDAIHAKDPVGFAHAQKAIHLHLAGDDQPVGEHEEAGLDGE